LRSEHPWLETRHPAVGSYFQRGGYNIKMWFPDRWQWIALWSGLLLVYAALDNNEEETALFFAIGAVFLVWMLESRRRKNRKE
jgi:hypothetical protein